MCVGGGGGGGGARAGIIGSHVLLDAKGQYEVCLLKYTGCV